jgi:hypothetical protein
MRRARDAKKTIIKTKLGIIKKLDSEFQNRFSKEVSLSDDSLEALNNFNGEPNVVSFIVRVWKENAGLAGTEENWLGYITPVQPGERQYFTNINQISALIAAHLNKEG